eukprot:TRINITY_DN26314_c0_g1_i1.p1 TRINITY_DN26314_c0_g1~~TRINITY_DN26314_c0_g1_i1.p1  ORF type:complete len:295 (+),score=49.95 TRINITY_DN26314_c0_g1_i1:69-887(+)
MAAKAQLALQKPGKATICTLLFCLVLGFLDALSLLPHPTANAVSLEMLGSMMTMTASLPDSSATKTIEEVNPLQKQIVDELKALAYPNGSVSSSEVREYYHARLKVLQTKLGDFQRNMGNPESKITPCDLAEVAVKERERARIEARSFGSSGQHLVLILRDLFVYGSLTPFTLEKMMRKKKHQLDKQHGTKTSDAEVCNALVESSTRSNPSWDKSAKEAADHWQMSYAQETMAMYLVLVVALTIIVYLAEVLYGFSSARGGRRCLNTKKSVD